MTEREWQRFGDTMRFIVEQQARFESNFAAAEERFARVEERLEKGERRMDRMERYAGRIIKQGEQRMARDEAEAIELRETLQSFLEAMCQSAGNGKGKTYPLSFSRFQARPTDRFPFPSILCSRTSSNPFRN